MREKSLQSVLLKENQEQFGNKIATLASTTENFNCCGVHIAIEQIKEIPVQSYTVPASAAQLASQSSGPTADSELSGRTAQAPEPIQAEKPRVVAAELSLSRKGNIFTKAVSAAVRFRSLNRLPIHMKFRGFIVFAAIIVAPLLTVAIIRAGGNSGEVKIA